MLQFQLNRNPQYDHQRPPSTGGSSSGAGDRYNPRQASPVYNYHQHSSYDPRVASSSSKDSPAPGRPEDRSLPLSHGTPFALANIRPGEYVAVIGIGDGIDLLRVSNIVGASGSAVGLDSKSEILSSTRSIPAVSSSRNIFLILTQPPHIHLPRSSVDTIIISSSTSLLNSVRESERPKLFQELFRILKPGGRLCASSVMAKNVLPEHLKESLGRDGTHPSPANWYEYWLKEAGFADVAMAEVRQASRSRPSTSSDQSSGAAGHTYYPHLNPTYSPSPPPSGSWSGGDMQGVEGPSASSSSSSSNSMSIQQLTSQTGQGASLPPIQSGTEQQQSEWVSVYNVHAVRPMTRDD